MDNSLLHRREAIILTSIEVINQFGIQGLSTREVAKRQGISEGTIFKHFKTKNDLMLAILDHYSQYDADIAASVRLKSFNPIEAIKYFINAYAEYYQNYPQITAITQAYDVLSCDPGLTERVKEIYSNRFSFLKALITEAQRAEVTSQSIDSEKLTDIIWGSFRGICLKWRLCNYCFPLQQYILSTVDLVLDAFMNEAE